MSNFYSNLPQPSKSNDSAQGTVQLFDSYNKTTFNVDSGTYDAMIGFFGSKGFEQDAAETMAYTILKQAKIDNINPFTLIETLKGLNSIQLSSLVTEIINFNRYKTSSLGTASPFTPAEEVARNIIP